MGVDSFAIAVNQNEVYPYAEARDYKVSGFVATLCHSPLTWRPGQPRLYQ